MIYRETPLMTNAVARDLTREGRYDEVIRGMWASKLDTAEMARALEVRECEVVRRLWLIREQRRASCS